LLKREMRIDRHPCPRCNSTLTSAAKGTPLYDDIVVLRSKCFKCKLNWVIGVTTPKLEHLNKRKDKIMNQYMRETKKYGLPRTVTRVSLQETIEQINEEKSKHGLNAQDSS
jgi:5,10-methylene-tetrahydrofolate dehydrogenase/methenyl tetrahydrofolate cyclohydrolase